MVICDPNKMMWPNGWESGLWVAGHLVYGGAVLMANTLILLKFHIHDMWHLIPITLMITAYFLFLWLESMSGDFRDL